MTHHTTSLDRLLRACLALLLLLELAVAGFGLYFVALDLQVSGEMFDGLGMMIGGVLLLAAALPAAAAGRAWWLSRRGRASAAGWAATAGLASATAAFSVASIAASPFALAAAPGLLVALVALVSWSRGSRAVETVGSSDDLWTSAGR